MCFVRNFEGKGGRGRGGEGTPENLHDRELSPKFKGIIFSTYLGNHFFKLSIFRILF